MNTFRLQCALLLCCLLGISSSLLAQPMSINGRHDTHQNSNARMPMSINSPKSSIRAGNNTLSIEGIAGNCNLVIGNDLRIVSLQTASGLAIPLSTTQAPANSALPANTRSYALSWAPPSNATVIRGILAICPCGGSPALYTDIW